MNSIIGQYFSNPLDASYPSIMIGEVINNNDPQQMGRVQVHIATQSTDRNLTPSLQHFPWASYASPFGGIDSVSRRGPASPDAQFPDYGDNTEGPVAYGMWAIPKVGARVLLCSVDNDPNQLYWFGCIYPNSTPHTLPHGRYSVRTGSGEPDGPLSTTESPIAPLYDNLTKAFGDRSNFEWRSRGADYQAAAATKKRVDDADPRTQILSEVHDDGEETLTEGDGTNFGDDYNYRQGYGLSRSDPELDTNTEADILRDRQVEKNLESQVNSWTSPGFHAISMDDRQQNARMRFRSSTGHQIILDDTNERIYISSNEGRNWIEMDSDGHVYIFSEESISMRAEGDLNLTAEKTVRLTGKEGVHIQTENEFRLNADKDIHIRGESNMFAYVAKETHFHGVEDIYILNDTDTHIHSDNLRILTDTNMHSEVNGVFTVNAPNVKIDSDGTQFLAKDLDVTGQAKVGSAVEVGSLKSGGAISAGADISSSQQSLNALNGHTHEYNPGPSPPAPTAPFGQGGAAAPAANPTPQDVASEAEDAQPAEKAYWTNIIPAHEPWARTFVKNFEENLDHEPELPYDDPGVGRNMKKVKEQDRKRGKLWHR